MHEMPKKPKIFLLQNLQKYSNILKVCCSILSLCLSAGVGGIDRKIKANFVELLEKREFGALAQLAPVVFADNAELWQYAVNSLFQTDDALNVCFFFLPSTPVSALTLLVDNSAHSYPK
jgi:hypothetical protein